MNNNDRIIHRIQGEAVKPDDGSRPGDPRSAAKNTDRELWREREGDYYAPSLFVTQGGGIGINVGGTVIVKSLRAWHDLAMAAEKFTSRLHVGRVPGQQTREEK